MFDDPEKGDKIEIVRSMAGDDFRCIEAAFIDVTAFGEGLSVRIALGMAGVINTGLFARLDLEQLAILRDALGKICEAFEAVAPASERETRELESVH